MNNPIKGEDNTVDFSKDFFGKASHLTVSGQLNGETQKQVFQKFSHLKTFHVLFEDLYQNEQEIQIYHLFFQVLLNPDGKTVAACDLLAPGIGEIIGGSQREFQLDTS